MADKDKLKLASCPICGYTDTSTDAEALDSDIRAHVKTVHNLDPENLGLSGNVKLESPNNGDSTDTPAITPVVNVGNSPPRTFGIQGAVIKKDDSELINKD